MQTQVLAANANYPSDPGEILKTVSDNDKLWKKSLAAQRFSDPIIRSRLNNDIAEELKQFSSIFPANYDMALTDVYGGLLASTGLVSSYYQGIQFWWQTANNNGAGQVYISAPVYEFGLETKCGDYRHPRARAEYPKCYRNFTIHICPDRH